MKKLGCVAISLFLLSGCSVFGEDSPYAFWRNNQTLYLKSQAAPPVQVPAGWEGTQPEDKLVIPEGAAANPATPEVSLLPPGSLASKVQSGEVPKTVLKQDPDKITATTQLPGIAP